jgi:hypothetical protein
MGELMNTMTRREFLFWRLYTKTFGPIHWRRDDWNFAEINHHIAGVVGGKEYSGTTRDQLLNFVWSEETARSESEKSVQILVGMGLPPKDIDELLRACM